MKKFTSIITITFPSDIAFNEWSNITKDFFLKDKNIVRFLKENGMTKWTWSKTDEIEPVRVVIVMEYESEKSFGKCQKVFSKYMPSIRNNGMLYKTNIIRGNVIFDQI